MTKKTVRTGLEQFITSPPDEIYNLRLGLLCNPASIDRHFRHARHLINEQFPNRLKALYSPQHGFYADKQDNMIESAHLTDPDLGIPVFSLYGETRIPTREMFEPIDLLLVDIQDAGTRVYTFIYTLSYCMEAARKYGKKMIVLDRPNPVGGAAVEGNLLKPEWSSFVGRYPIPMRHGLTIGEIAKFFNDHFGIGCDLSVIPMTGWKREMMFRDTGLPWIAPSPNLPTPESALVYPGQVIWEGTNVSEGRGTTQPFELFGAPFFEPDRILDEIGGPNLPGALLRPAAFEPTSNKWSGELCRGFQIHVTDSARFLPYRTALELLRAVLKLYPNDFEWKQPPYEYEHERMPIDLILGDRSLRLSLEELESIEKLEEAWKDEIDRFKALSGRYHLY